MQILIYFKMCADILSLRSQLFKIGVNMMGDGNILLPRIYIELHFNVPSIKIVNLSFYPKEPFKLRTFISVCIKSVVIYVWRARMKTKNNMKHIKLNNKTVYFCFHTYVYNVFYVLRRMIAARCEWIILRTHPPVKDFVSLHFSFIRSLSLFLSLSIILSIPFILSPFFISFHFMHSNWFQSKL